MNKFNSRLVAVMAVLLLSIGIMIPMNAWADENEVEREKTEAAGTSISLMPVSKVLQISSSSEYEDKMTVTNDGDDDIEIEVYAAPYSYVYSEDDGVYKLGFNHENNFTQIVRWIRLKNNKGEWAKTANYKVPAHGSVDVKYKISTPKDIPAGGQYAVIFAHTLTGVVSANGIKTEASPGMVIYGRSTEGDIRVSASISDMKVGYGSLSSNGDNATSKNNFAASAKVKNEGNVDFSAVGKLKVESIIGFSGYETPNDRGRVSVIPESELEVRDEWEDSPGFGLYKATWTVTAGDATDTVETIVFVNPVPFVIITILVLTIVTIWIIMVIRKRKERSSRLAV